MAGTLIVEYRLFYLMLFNGEPTIRVIRQGAPLGWKGSFMYSVDMFFKGAGLGIGHFQTLHRYILWFCVASAAYFNLYKERAFKEILFFWQKKEYTLWALIVLIITIYGLSFNSRLLQLIESIFPVMKGFILWRIIYSTPILWYSLFALYLVKFRYSWVSSALLCLQFFYIFRIDVPYNDLYRNLPLVYAQKTPPLFTYSQFYMEKTFQKLKNEISYAGEYSAVVGFHPAVLTYNGISTLDAYLSYRSLQSHKDFREIIAPELETNEWARSYYDNYGIRAYLFNSALPIVGTQQHLANLPKDGFVLKINPEAFQRLKGKYIFSPAPIANAQALGLRLKAQAASEEIANQTIFVYGF